MTEMVDSDTATYPDGVQYIAAYVDGSRTGQNYYIARNRNPQAKFLLVSAVGDADADVIDIEPGNVWPPANAVDWTIRQRSLGKNPGYYCNTSTQQDVLNAYAARGVNPGWWWRADYRDPSQRPASFALGELAHQYADPPMTGGHWDASVIAPALQAYLDGNASALSGNVQPIVIPPAPVQNGFLAMLDDAMQQQLADRINWLYDNRRLFYPYQLLRDNDANSATSNLIVLTARDLWWPVPDPAYIGVIQAAGLAGDSFDVNGAGDGNIFGFAKAIILADANDDKLNAITAALNSAVTANNIPALVDALKAAIPDNKMSASEIVSTLQSGLK